MSTEPEKERVWYYIDLLAASAQSTTAAKLQGELGISYKSAAVRAMWCTRALNLYWKLWPPRCMETSAGDKISLTSHPKLANVLIINASECKSTVNTKKEWKNWQNTQCINKGWEVYAAGALPSAFFAILRIEIDPDVDLLQIQIHRCNVNYGA
jgi:hypothetical protein